MSHAQRIIANAIRSAVGDPEYVARVIVEDLEAAGYSLKKRTWAT